MGKEIYINPPRLVEDKELGPWMRSASEVTFDASRLATSRAALLARTAAASMAPPIRPPRLLPRKRTAFAAAAALLLMSAGAVAVIYVQTKGLQNDAPPLSPTPPEQRPDKTKRVRYRRPVEAMPTVEQSAVDVGADGGIAPFNRDSKPRRVDRNFGGESALDEQMRMFNKAKAHLASGEFDSAVRQVRRLKQRFPKGPLSVEADELQARGLFGLHQYEEASDTVQSLIRAKIPTRKKAQLYRFLGDLQRKQHRCDHAVESYRMALGLGLSNIESNAARSGIRACRP